MQTFRTHIDLYNHYPTLGLDHRTYFLGSCFSEHIAAKLLQRRMHVRCNPGGILFDPISLLQYLQLDLGVKQLQKEHFVKRDELYYSYTHHSSQYANTEESLFYDLNNQHQENNEWLKKTDFLFITLGTSIVRRHVIQDIIVANCHKQNANLFQKQYLDFALLQRLWINFLPLLFDQYPNLTIIFTVSPVRHIKEGLLENQKSKSILRIFADRMADHFSKVYYYPAYEIMIDDLRDYRFYKADMLHPNATAVAYIFNHFSKSFFSEESRMMIKEIEKLNARLAHKPLHPDSYATKAFNLETEKTYASLRKKYPKLNWS